MGHGNHWECLGGTAEERVGQFIPLVCASGQVGPAVKRTAKWFDSEVETEESIVTVEHPETPLRCLAMLVSNQATKSHSLYSGFPYAAEAAPMRLSVDNIRDWGNHVEGVLECSAPLGGTIAFFDTHYYRNRDGYKVGKEFDFRLAGLLYSLKLVNGETVTVTDQEVLAQRWAAYGKEPKRDAQGLIEPDIIHLDGMVALFPSDGDWPEDAQYRCQLKEVSTFMLEDILVYRLVPELEEDQQFFPGILYAAAAVLQDGYVPKPGDNISGRVWVQGFLDETAAGLAAT